MRYCICLLLLVIPLASLAEEAWIAVGYGGRRMISTDAKTWTITAEWAQPGGDDGNNLMSACFAQGKFVVVGGGGGGKTGAGHILVSRDGRTWEETYKSNSRVNPVVYGKDCFVAGTGAWPSGKLLWSIDAITWKEGAVIQSKGLTHFRHGAYGNGVFVLVGNGRQKNAAGEEREIHWAIVSPDGETITHETAELPAHGDIHFGAGRFVMLSHEGIMLSSADGKTWQTHPFEKEAAPRWLVWDGNRFLAGNHKVGWQSPDGLKWESSSVIAGQHVKWSDGKQFIATGWPGKMFHSDDGKVWTSKTALTDNGINKVVHGHVEQTK
jgi:hypothetical protein